MDELKSFKIFFCSAIVACFKIASFAISRDGQYRDTCIGDTYRAILLYRYRYRLSVQLQYRLSVSIKHVFEHRRYKYLDTVFEHDQSYQVLTACLFMVSEECEIKRNSPVDSKRRTVRKFLLSLAYLQLFRNAIERR